MADPINVSACSEASNCPGIVELSNGDFTVTGVLAFGGDIEATVVVPGGLMAAVFEQALVQRDEWHRQNGVLRGELEAARAEVEALRARLGEPQRKRSTTVWAIAWDRDGGTTYSFPIESERYARNGYADLVRNGVTGMRLVVSRDGVRWRDAAASIEGGV